MNFDSLSYGPSEFLEILVSETAFFIMRLLQNWSRCLSTRFGKLVQSPTQVRFDESRIGTDPKFMA